MAALDLDFTRSFFPPMANGWTYMENAGGSYMPSQVIARMNAYMAECKNQPHPNFGPGALAAERLEASRQAAAAIVGADLDEIVIGPSTTLNVYVLAQALRHLFADGDEIVVTNQDHEANGGAWRRLTEFGLVIREWQVDPVTGELDLAGLDALLNERTKLVCCPHVSNVVGSINPVAAIAAKAHAAGAMVCVDGVAYAAHGLIDVKAWDVDFYLFSTYKIYGPHLAVMYGKREAIARCANQNHFFHEGKGATCINPGGLAYEAVAGIAGVLEYFEAIYSHHLGDQDNDQRARLTKVFDLFGAQEEQLSERLLSYLRTKPGVRLIGEKTGDHKRREPTIAFSVEGRPSAAISAAVADDKIALASGHFYGYRCVEALGYDDVEDGVVRASMVHYNTLDEVDRLIVALEKAI